MDLFESNTREDMEGSGPLADRMRPQSLSQLIGQEHITREGSLLHQAIAHDRVFSMILWGPPGCGKTTLAGIIANETQCDFIRISAVLSGVKEVRRIIEKAGEVRRLYKRRTLLFVDEIHRFNKAQQDAFLHHVETGLITLVGATTENPSFEVIPALVSRCRVFALKSLESDDIIKILERAAADPEKGLGISEEFFSQEALEHIARVSDGDARTALTNLETAAIHFQGQETISSADVETAVEKKSLLYDKAGEEHYNLISAFIKSMRGSDPDAAMYWMERMLAAGEDPYYMIRRMIRFATEDIGLADPGALTMALNAGESFRILGRPEGDGSLFQAAVYLATAPKSNSVYAAQKQVRQTVEDKGYAPVPLHIRNAPTGLMKKMNYGKGYRYAHDHKDGFIPQSYLPDNLEGTRFYFPTDRGYENTVKQRLEAWLELKKGKPGK
ncbi:replication-associated recombination protein A [Desulfospira joergensenii]|uniref:replication-associated recombination protein A n=1 Tax=Desulfospira joergensenii TaxID=53329 RepID=UPI0003B62BB1|nr:replication-associated recombination protein A [Desulfospira joergensenii]